MVSLVGFWVVRIVRCWRTKNSGGRRFTGPPWTTTRWTTTTTTTTSTRGRGWSIYGLVETMLTHSGADLPGSSTFDSPRYLVEPYRHAARKMHGHCASSGCRLRQISRRFSMPSGKTNLLPVFSSAFLSLRFSLLSFIKESRGVVHCWKLGEL